MDYLWAPWRVKYIFRLKKRDQGQCVFCQMIKQKNDKATFIVERAQHTFSVLNIYPYNNGHIMIVPYRHVADLTKLTSPEKLELFELMEKTKKLLDKTMKPNGYNIGINLGKAAGAGFPGHLHIHIVPRWKGDVNFMPVVANTKIVSQSLLDLWQRLYDANQAKPRRARR